MRERTDVSRQRKWQIKMIAEGRCFVCGVSLALKPREKRRACPFHREQIRRAQRRLREQKKAGLGAQVGG